MAKRQHEDTSFPPRVVHLKMKHGSVYQGCGVYIGRACNRGGWNLPKSKWANPFKLGTNGLKTPDDVLAAYEKHVRGNAKLMAALPELYGHTIGCWCKPKPCHGDVLVKLCREMQGKSEDQNENETEDE